MSRPAPEPTRLSRLSEAEDTAGIGRLFRQARDLADEDLPALRWRLRTSLRLRAIRPRVYLRIALVVGIVFCMGGVVGAMVSPLWPKKKVVVPASVAPAATPAPRHRKARPTTFSPATQSEPVPAPLSPAASEPVPADLPPAALQLQPVPEEHKPAAPELKPAVEAQPVRAVDKPKSPVGVATESEPAPPAALAPPARTSKPPAIRASGFNPSKSKSVPRAEKRLAPLRLAELSLPAQAPGAAPHGTAAVTPSAIAVEQALLGQAMRTLRDGHDGRGALALLEQHAERYPRGALTSEATVLRIEALLALGRRDEALSILDREPISSLPNRDEQLVVRGELRAAKGRWREAKQDFDDTLRERVLPAERAKARALQERALWGRAAVRSRSGDRNGARADLELYLRIFPGGRFAVPAASLLGAAP